MAQTSYPTRTITVVVPFAAGGPTDVVARILGEHMSQTLGQQLVVENVGGAGGTTGMTRVAGAEPDGYTIGVGNMGTQSAAPALYPNLKYNPATSFAQVGICNYTPQAIVAKKDTAAKDLKEFLEYLKVNSEKLSYGHAGVGSISHVSGTLFNSQFGLKPALVAYRGTNPALNDLVGGQIDYMVDQSLNVIPQIKGGTIKVFAVAAPARLESIPDVPTTKEAGVDFIFSAWNAMVAPKGTPKDIVDKLAAALDKALDDPATVKRYVELGSTTPAKADRGPEGLQKLVDSEMARITPVLKAAAASAEKK
ncbi:MAG: tripartite tricarboxylate transporter substrate-binding protein [Hyphomicrobiaceae bacterium]